MSDVRVTGANELARVAKVLRRIGANDLRKELLRAIRTGGADAVKDVRSNASDSLPRGGGLADLMASSKIGVRTRLSGNSASVKIRAERGEQVDRGTARHPVFGNPKVWASNDVRPGWFTQPLEDSAPEFRTDIERALDKIKRQVEGRF